MSSLSKRALCLFKYLMWWNASVVKLEIFNIFISHWNQCSKSCPKTPKSHLYRFTAHLVRGLLLNFTWQSFASRVTRYKPRLTDCLTGQGDQHVTTCHVCVCVCDATDLPDHEEVSPPCRRRRWPVSWWGRNRAAHAADEGEWHTLRGNSRSCRRSSPATSLGRWCRSLWFDRRLCESKNWSDSVPDRKSRVTYLRSSSSIWRPRKL